MYLKSRVKRWENIAHISLFWKVVGKTSPLNVCNRKFFVSCLFCCYWCSRLTLTCLNARNRAGKMALYNQGPLWLPFLGDSDSYAATVSISPAFLQKICHVDKLNLVFYSVYFYYYSQTFFYPWTAVTTFVRNSTKCWIWLILKMRYLYRIKCVYVGTSLFYKQNTETNRQWFERNDFLSEKLHFLAKLHKTSQTKVSWYFTRKRFPHFIIGISPTTPSSKKAAKGLKIAFLLKLIAFFWKQ